MHDEHYEDIVLQDLPAEYERVPNASYEKRGFELVDIRYMVHTMFVDSVSRSSHSKSVADSGIAIQGAGHTPTATCGAATAAASNTSCQTALP